MKHAEHNGKHLNNEPSCGRFALMRNSGESGGAEWTG